MERAGGVAVDLPPLSVEPPFTFTSKALQAPLIDNHCHGLSDNVEQLFILHSACRLCAAGVHCAYGCAYVEPRGDEVPEWDLDLSQSNPSANFQRLPGPAGGRETRGSRALLSSVGGFFQQVCHPTTADCSLPRGRHHAVDVYDDAPTNIR